MKLARIGNKYLADTEPWKLIKTQPERVETILNIALQITANLAIVFEPFMPSSSLRLAQMMNIELPNWNDAGKDDLIGAGHQLRQAEILFAKIEDDMIQEQIDKLQQASN